MIDAAKHADVQPTAVAAPSVFADISHLAVAATAQANANSTRDQREDAGQVSQQQSRLDLGIGVWLAAQGEETAIPGSKGRALADVLRTELQASTLRDLIGVVQHPADWARFVPDDPERCQQLWLALLREAELAQKEAVTPRNQAEDVPAWFETLRYEIFC